MTDKAFGDRLTWLRKDLGLEVNQAIQKLKISVNSYRDHEKGKLPSRNTMERYIEFYGCDRNWLLTGIGEPFPGKEKPAQRPGAPYIQPSGEDRYVSSVRPLYNNKEGEPGAQAEIRVSDALVAASRVLDSRTSYATALFLNIQHFDRAIQAERSLHQLTEENRQLKARVAALEKECEDLRKRLAALEARVSCNPRETVAAA